MLTLRWQTWLENLPGMMMYDDFQRLNLRGYATGISVARGLFCRGLWGSDLCHRRPVKESTKHQWWSGGDTHKKTTLKSRSFYWTESSSIFYIYVILCVYIYGPVLRLSTHPPNGLGPQVVPRFPSICKLLAAFLRSSLVLLGLCSISDYQPRIY